MTPSLTLCKLARLVVVSCFTLVVAGCQTKQVVAPEPRQEGRSFIKLYHHDKAENQKGISLVAKHEVLQRAIRHGFPEATIKADSGIDLNRRVDVWADNLTPTGYLDHLASQANVFITMSGQNNILVQSSREQTFYFPTKDSTLLIPQAERLAQSAGAHVIRIDGTPSLLVSGSPRSLEQVSRAFALLNSRITLENELGAAR